MTMKVLVESRASRLLTKKQDINTMQLFGHKIVYICVGFLRHYKA